MLAVICRRRHLSSTQTDDFCAHVRLKLVESKYAILSQFGERSSLRTYLTVVFQRLFLDYQIREWGKWRPSVEAKRMGPVAVLLEKLLVRDGCSLDEAFELMRTNHRISIERAEIEALAGRLPPRTRRRFESDEQLVLLPSRDISADQAMEQRDRRAASVRVFDELKSIIAKLDVRDQLILAMRFEDGRKLAEIATVLQVDEKAFYRWIPRLLKRIEEELLARGVDKKLVSEIIVRGDEGG